jgi:hypothetical protein
MVAARGEIRCQFIILARKDQPTPDYTPAISRGSCYGKEIGRSQNGDPLKSPQRQQMLPVKAIW